MGRLSVCAVVVSLVLLSGGCTSPARSDYLAPKPPLVSESPLAEGQAKALRSLGVRYLSALASGDQTTSASLCESRADLATSRSAAFGRHASASEGSLTVVGVRDVAALRAVDGSRAGWAATATVSIAGGGEFSVRLFGRLEPSRTVVAAVADGASR